MALESLNRNRRQGESAPVERTYTVESLVVSKMLIQNVGFSVISHEGVSVYE